MPEEERMVTAYSYEWAGKYGDPLTFARAKSLEQDCGFKIYRVFEREEGLPITAVYIKCARPCSGDTACMYRQPVKVISKPVS